MLPPNLRPWLTAVLTVAVVLPASFLCSNRTVDACPFCSAVSQTLRQEMATMDAVVIAESIPGEVQDTETGMVRMRVVKVLRGSQFVDEGKMVTPVYYGNVGEGRRFLLTGVDPPNLQWSLMPISERGEAYVLKVLSLPDDEAKRLRFFRNYLEDDEPMLARDAYDEFAITPYEAVRAIKDDMDHDRLVKWIEDPDMPADRKRLYLTMLGVCGSEKDLPMLAKLLNREQKQGGLDAMIACYLSLAGEQGLPLVNEKFLANKQAPYTETYAAIMAVRFHGTESDVIPRSALLPSLHHILDRPELADLVISDLARWGDWSQIDRLTALFENATEDNNFVRVPVVNYLRACPLPEAAEALKRLEQIDPESVRRSNIFFAKPMVKPEPAPKSTSAILPPKSLQPKKLTAQACAAERPQVSPGRVSPVQDSSGRAQLDVPVAAAMPIRAGASRAAAGPLLIPANAPVAVARPANPLGLLNVVVMALSTMLILAWLILTSGAPATEAGTANE